MKYYLTDLSDHLSNHIWRRSNYASAKVKMVHRDYSRVKAPESSVWIYEWYFER